MCVLCVSNGIVIHQYVIVVVIIENYDINGSSFCLKKKILTNIYIYISLSLSLSCNNA